MRRRLTGCGLIENRARDVEGRCGAVEGRCSGVEGRASAVEGRCTSVEGRSTAVEGRATAVEGRCSNLESADVALDGRVDVIESALISHGGDLSSLDGRLDTLEGQTLDSRLDTLEGQNLDSRLDTLEPNVATKAGAEELSNKTLIDPAITGTVKEDIYAITDAVAFEINPRNGSIQTITLTSSRTPKGTSFAAGDRVTLMIDDGASAYAITWTDATFGTGGVKWLGGSPPALPTTGYGCVELWKVGSQVYGRSLGNA